MAQPATDAANTPQKPLLEQAVEFLRACDRWWLVMAAIALAAIGVAFWPLLRELPSMWLGTAAWELRTGDGYY